MDKIKALQQAQKNKLMNQQAAPESQNSQSMLLAPVPSQSLAADKNQSNRQSDA